jgi:glycine/D-amino acid oxidase-like deaminating enzyme
MNLTSSHLFWSVNNGLPENYPSLQRDVSCDAVVIVGGEDEDFVNAKHREALIFSKDPNLDEKVRATLSGCAVGNRIRVGRNFRETKDGLAYIGVHPQFPHAYFALGYGGNGITFSLVAAEILRDGLLNRTNRDAHLFRFGR